MVALAVGSGVLALSTAPAFAGSPGVFVSPSWDAGLGITDGAGGGLGGGGVLNPLICKNLIFQFVGPVAVTAASSGTQAASGTVNLGTSTWPMTSYTTGNLLGPCPSSAGENLLSGTGRINAFHFSPNTSVVGSVSGSCDQGPGGTAGTYTRIGAALVVSLACNETVTGATGAQSTTDHLNLTAVAGLVPDRCVGFPCQYGENGITTSITHVIAQGAVAGVGTS